MLRRPFQAAAVLCARVTRVDTLPTRRRAGQCRLERWHDDDDAPAETVQLRTPKAVEGLRLEHVVDRDGVVGVREDAGERQARAHAELVLRRLGRVFRPLWVRPT